MVDQTEELRKARVSDREQRAGAREAQLQDDLGCIAHAQVTLMYGGSQGLGDGS